MKRSFIDNFVRCRIRGSIEVRETVFLRQDIALFTMIYYEDMKCSGRASKEFFVIIILV